MFKRLPSALTCTLFLFSSCSKQYKQVSFDSNVAVDEALSSEALNNVRVHLAWLGETKQKEPLSRFMPKRTVDGLIQDLKNLNSYSFLGCQGAAGLNYAQDASACDRVNKSDNTLQFKFVIYNKNTNRVCQDFYEDLGNCRIHQAVLLVPPNAGVQKSALYVEKKSLEKNIFLTVRKKHNRGLVNTAFILDAYFQGRPWNQGQDYFSETYIEANTSYRMFSSYGKIVSNSLAYGDTDFSNLLQVSNKYLENIKEFKIRRQRQLGFGIGLTVLSSGTFGAGVAALAGVSKLSQFGFLVTVSNIASGFSGAALGLSFALNLEEEIGFLEKGSAAHRSAQITLLLADVAPWLGLASLGVNALPALSTQVTKIKALSLLAKKLNIPVKQLSKLQVTKVVDRVIQKNAILTENLRSKQYNEMAKHADDIADDVAKSTAQVRTTSHILKQQKYPVEINTDKWPSWFKAENLKESPGGKLFLDSLSYGSDDTIRGTYMVKTNVGEIPYNFRIRPDPDDISKIVFYDKYNSDFLRHLHDQANKHGGHTVLRELRIENSWESYRATKAIDQDRFLYLIKRLEFTLNRHW